jgi:capsular exopolysaccharide synthesis family protein
MIMGKTVLDGVTATTTIPICGSLNVSPVKDTQFIQLTYTSTDPTNAPPALNAIADYFSQYVSELYFGKRADTLAVLEEQIKRAQIDLDNSQRQLAALENPSASELEVAQAKVTFYQKTYMDYLSQLDAARKAETQETTRVIVYERASLPGAPIPPRTSLNLAVAIVLGLFLGIGLAFLRDYLDDTLKTEVDVTAHMKGLPVLGAIPVIPRNGGKENCQEDPALASLRPKEKDSPFAAVALQPKSAAAEGFRTLRTNIQFFSADHPPRSLVVTSAAPSEGKTTMSANLAVSLARMGQKVVLVDADLRRPGIQKVFGLSGLPGLGNYLIGKAELSAILKQTPIANLTVITSGPLPPMPAELLGSQRMRELSQQLKGQFDLVILDTPPAMAVTDATLLDTIVDGLLLVVSCGKSTREQAKAGLLTLGKAGITPLGMIMNQVDRRKGYGYYYYYYRKYYSRYQQEREEEEVT